MDEAWIKEAMRLADACMSLYGDYRILVERYGVSADTISSARNAYLGAESDLEAHLRTMMKGEPVDKDQRQALEVLDKLHQGKIGAHWIWCALKQIANGQDEVKVLAEYGYVYKGPNSQGILDSCKPAVDNSVPSQASKEGVPAPLQSID